MTGLFSIPEGMAYASVAWFGPVAGPYAGVVPAVVGSPTARTVLMVTTLTSAIARPRARVEGGIVPVKGALFEPLEAALAEARRSAPSPGRDADDADAPGT
ncbi:hypothetical protein [Streptomyces rubrogriseus]|uniref:hypothetical protein n=1 Tax=Streptomyces rubrogriseus TaxID=194673 RepID=UPI0037CE0B50